MSKINNSLLVHCIPKISDVLLDEYGVNSSVLLVTTDIEFDFDIDDLKNQLDFDEIYLWDSEFDRNCIVMKDCLYIGVVRNTTGRFEQVPFYITFRSSERSIRMKSGVYSPNVKVVNGQYEYGDPISISICEFD